MPVLKPLSTSHMTQQLPERNSHADDGDRRPNSGLREGDITHAEVNEALRQLPKTIIFGQQNRLRNGVLIEEDERLDRFHAGHDLASPFARFSANTKTGSRRRLLAQVDSRSPVPVSMGRFICEESIRQAVWRN
jgi:hypothetical protein